jgi:hypothetical protein
MEISLCINPLFALVSSVNCLYITNKEVFPISSMEIGIFVLGLRKLLSQSLGYRIRLLCLWGDPLCRWVTLVDLVISCGGEEKAAC